MNDLPSIPDDENGRILRNMLSHGDDLSKPRMMDFCFVFPEHKQVLAFAELIEERDLEVCISYYEEREMWQAKVHRYMIPDHTEISSLETSLSSRAEIVGGEADGWGCMIVNGK